MKQLLLIMITLYSSTIVASNNIEVTYTLTSSCVLSADIHKSDTPDNWDVYIKVNAVEADKLSAFSKKHIKKLIRTVNANGETLSVATLMGPISSLFFLPAESKEKALLIKNSLLKIPGKCGHNVHAN